MNTDNLSNQENTKNHLIQRATTRLRRILLEENLQDFMRQLIHFQTRLETIRVDTMATISIVSNMPEETTEEGIQKMNRQMDTLEKRLESHSLELSQFLGSPSETSSDISSLSTTSTVATSINASFDSVISDRRKKEKRRTRVKDHKRRYQETVLSSHSEYQQNSDWDLRVLCTDDEEDENSFYDLSGKRSFGSGSFCGSVYTRDEPQTSSEGGMTNRRRRQRRREYVGHQDTSLTDSFSCSSESLIDSEDDQYGQANDIWALQAHYMETQLYPQPNILEEAMSFLDGVEDDVDDGGFCEDLYLLLRNPDLCCRPFSEIESTMHELRQQKKSFSLHSIFYKATLSTVKWCRFLTILSTAMVISIMKGPNDLLVNPPIST